MTPTVVMQGTSSVGISLVFWVLGAVIAIAGVLVFSELGLTIPRMHVEGQQEKKSVPRNGGEKNYVRNSPSHPRPSFPLSPKNDSTHCCILKAGISLQETRVPRNMPLRHPLHRLRQHSRQRHLLRRERHPSIKRSPHQRGSARHRNRHNHLCLPDPHNLAKRRSPPK